MHQSSNTTNRSTMPDRPSSNPIGCVNLLNAIVKCRGRIMTFVFAFNILVRSLSLLSMGQESE